MIPAGLPGVEQASATDSAPHDTGVGGPRSYPQRQKEANLPLIFSGPDGHVAVAGIGGARSVAMSRRMSPNRWREMATSAIWNAI
jgi:hypothetical protein